MSTVLKERNLPGGRIIQIAQGDLTAEEVDAIVNAANENLQHGGGVAWAISRRGGPVIQQESDAWIRAHGPVSHAHPAWTSGGLLSARYVIHAVGPVWGTGDEDAKLIAAVSGSLHVADELALKSVALPAISTGIFGFPKKRAAEDMFKAVQTFFETKIDSSLQLVRFVLFDQKTVDAFLSIWEQA